MEKNKENKHSSASFSKKKSNKLTGIYMNYILNTFVEEILKNNWFIYENDIIV